jgi:hypothetical protein
VINRQGWPSETVRWINAVRNEENGIRE